MAKHRVVIFTNTRFPDLDSNQFVRLYIPVNEDGKVVTAADAVNLECWSPYHAQLQDAVPEMLNETVGVFEHAILGQFGSNIYATLPYNAAIYSIGRLTKWLRTMVRTPEYDTVPLSVDFSRN